MKIIGISLVRSAADIVGTTIRYHLHLGFDEVLVIDNGSPDGTAEILDRLAQSNPRVRWRSDEGAYQQAELTTQLAREAFHAGADWVVPFDADEFWYAPSASFRDVLSNSSAGALRASLVHYIQVRDQSHATAGGLLTMTRRAPRMIGPPDRARALIEAKEIGFVEAMYPPKWICRASEELEFAPGSHAAANISGTADTTAELVCLHAPLRSRNSLLRKAEHSERLVAAGMPPYQGWHVHRAAALIAADGLESEWAANSYDEDALDVYGTRRPVIWDPTLRDAVAPFIPSASSQPLASSPDEPRIDRGLWQRSITQDFLTSLHDDALARTAWARDLDHTMGRMRSALADTERYLADRTTWARNLDEELERTRAVVAELQALIVDRTAWAQAAVAAAEKARTDWAHLRDAFDERTAWAMQLQRELEAAQATIAQLEGRHSHNGAVPQATEEARVPGAGSARNHTSLTDTQSTR